MGSVVTGPPLTSASSTDNGDLSRQLGVPGNHASLLSPSTAIGLGQALTRVLQFSSVLTAEDQKLQKSQLSHWEKVVEEFFTSSATLKLTLWKDNQPVEAKVFEIGTPALPRFFLVTSQSGVKSMTLSLDGARERIVGPNQAVVQCVSAVWTHRYRNGYTVTVRGPFQAHVVVTPNATPSGAWSVPPTAFKLMIDHIQFDSNRYEKHVAVEAIGGTRLDANKAPQVGNVSTPSPTMNVAGVLPAPPPQPPQPSRQASQRDDEKWEEPRITFERVSIPAEPVNAFGIPQATMRCLESQQQARQSFTPRIPPGLLPMNPTMLPPNSTLLPPNPMLLPPNPTLLLQGRPAITGASIPPPQPRPIMGPVVTGPPLTSTPLINNGDRSRQPGVPGIHASLPSSPSPAIGLGQALIRVLQFSGVLAAEDQKLQKSQLSHWEKVVEEYFTSSATLKLTLWKDNQPVEAKVFEIGTPGLPRFFLVTSQSGVKSMTWSLDGVRERVLGPDHVAVQCVSAAWTYRYRNGYTVTVRGPFTAHVVVTPNATPNDASARSAPLATFKLMIDRIQFDSNRYEKHVAVEAIGGTRLDANKAPQVGNASTPSPTINGADILPAPPPQLPRPPRQASQRDDEKWEEPRITFEGASIPAEPVNAFGIPQATMRCLELAESVTKMELRIPCSDP